MLNIARDLVKLNILKFSNDCFRVTQIIDLKKSAFALLDPLPRSRKDVSIRISRVQDGIRYEKFITCKTDRFLVF
jgi:hypothetical protein